MSSAAIQEGPLRSSPGKATLKRISPLDHEGWDSLLDKQTTGCFFSSAAWAHVLHDTYGHRPVYFCGFEDNRLESLLPLMEVDSRVTGRRGVGLPFTDFCGPLQGNNAATSEPYEQAMAYGRERGWRYMECRGDAQGWQGARASVVFLGHVVGLTPDTERMHKALDSSVRRGVRKAEQSGIKVTFSDTGEAMDEYYVLHCQTRRRHGVPPQPKRFFENIARRVLATGAGFVAIARLNSKPIAGAVYFHRGAEGIYKFGASDFEFQQFRPNNLVMWEAMKHLTSRGCTYLHMGRTSLANEGLRRFKLGFGAREEKIEYARYDFRRKCFVDCLDRAESWANNVFRLMPGPILKAAGRLLYPCLS